MWAQYVSRPSRMPDANSTPTSALACLKISSLRRVEWKDRICSIDCLKPVAVVRPSIRADIMLCILGVAGADTGRRQCPGLLRFSIRKLRFSRTLFAETPERWE